MLYTYLETGRGMFSRYNSHFIAIVGLLLKNIHIFAQILKSTPKFFKSIPFFPNQSNMNIINRL